MIDVSQQIGATAREVSTGERDGRQTKVVLATRTYPAPVEDVWDALTDQERIPRWFSPVSGDLSVGGRFQVQDNAGGEVLSCEPPRAFEITWEVNGEPSWVVVTLTSDGDSTMLVLRHTAHVPEEFWGAYGPGAVGVGWELSLMGLDLHLASGAAVDPAEIETWSTSDEGRAYLGGSSAGWADAAIADGETEEQARSAQQATTAFYTGVPPEGASPPVEP